MKIGITLVIVLLVILGGLFFWNNYANAPHQTPTPSATAPVIQANIIVTSPKAGATVSNPITVTGKARVFENTFAYRLQDASGKVLYENHAMTSARDAGLFGSFTVQIPVPAYAPKNLIIAVFEYSAKDGSIINLVKVPVLVK